MQTKVIIALASFIVFILACLGCFYAGDVHRGKVDLAEYTAKIEAQNAQAEKQLADATAQTAAINQKNAELNTQLEADHAQQSQELATANAALASTARQLDSVRQRLSTRSGASGHSPMSGSANTAAQSATGSGNLAGSTPGSYSELVDIATLAIADAEYARECHDWAVRAIK
jgi:cell pole-organizing protein PopZ